MKITITSLILFLALSSATLVQAQGGGGHVGGGELCRDEIDKHRKAIIEWINQGFAKKIDFTRARKPGLTYELYESKMLDALKEGRVTVTCYDDTKKLAELAAKYGASKDKITIGAGCINYENKRGKSNIACDSDSILREKERRGATDDNYILTHHEFASIVGIEERLGVGESDFSISEQLSEFQHRETILLLGPKNPNASASTEDTRFNVLRSKFDAANTTFAMNKLSGDYLGTCYAPDSVPIEAILSTRLHIDPPGANEGPNFKSVRKESWRTMLVLGGRHFNPAGVTCDARKLESFGREYLDRSWVDDQCFNVDYYRKEDGMNVYGETWRIGDLLASDGEMLSSMTLLSDSPHGWDYDSNSPKNKTNRIRMSEDGYFYVRSTTEYPHRKSQFPEPSEVDCYFWKRVTGE